MPTFTKTKTPSKCRAWEQERRKRLGEAFSNLAAELPKQQQSPKAKSAGSGPSTTSASTAPCTKIVILQNALSYIQQLKSDCSSNINKAKAVDASVETDEIEEIKVLKSKCWELIKILVQAKIPLPTPPPVIIPAHKYANVADDSNKETGKSKNASSIKENSTKNNQSKGKADEFSKLIIQVNGDDDMDEENVKSDKSEEDNRGKSKSLDKDNNKSKTKGVGKEVKKKRCAKKKFNINRKHTRKKVTKMKAILSNIHNITSTSNVWVTNGTLRGPVVLPLLPSVLPPAPPTILINPFTFPLLTAPRKVIHGFDITRTTMVNKVPIPTTTFSLARKKIPIKCIKQPPPKRPTQIKPKNDSKKQKEKKTVCIEKENKKDKNNTAKAETETKNITTKQTTEVNKTIDQPDKDFANNQANSSTNKPNSNKEQEIKITESNKDHSAVTNENPKTTCSTIKEDSKVEVKPINPQQNQIKTNVEVKKEIEVEKSKVNELQKLNTTGQSQTSLKITINADDQINIKNANKDSLNTKLVTTNKATEETSGCTKESINKKRKIVESLVDNERQDIGHDIGEELSLPSPTAAFLLTFPLVCSGPTEPLQPPQDHFSNFFTRDPSAATQNNIFLQNNDCQTTKSTTVPVANDILKTTWTATPNTFTYPKMASNNTSILAMAPDRNTISMKETNKEIVTSSACVFSGAQNIFPPVSVCNNSYPFAESIFNYEHAPVSGNIKGIAKTSSYSQNSKVPFNFDNLHSDHKQTTGDSAVYSSISHPIVNNDVGSSFLFNNGDTTDKNSSLSTTFPNNSKKSYNNSGSCKLFFTTQSSSVAKNDALQSKPIFSNASSIYTSTNSYNPFDLPITPTTYSVPHTVANTNLRSKSSNMYFPDFSSNIYTQSCNLWMDESNAYGSDYTKTDSVKKTANSLNPVQNYSSPIVMDIAPDFRYHVSAPAKNTNIQVGSKNVTPLQSNKHIKTTSKISVKDPKYLVQENKDLKVECSTQKGPINWMTSEVNFAQNNNQDIFASNNQKDLRNNMLQSSNQCGVESNHSITGLAPSMTNKKTELYDQPLYMPSTGFVPQSFNEDNQFTWSPSKLMPLADSTPLVPCSLPTLVGDLALSMGDAKQNYQHLFLEQTDNSVPKNADKKNNQPKNKVPVKMNSSNNKVNCEINPSNVGTFLSVSQIMDRGKEQNVYHDNNVSNKNNTHYNQSKNMNLGNKSEMPVFPTEVFGVQQMTEYFPPPLHRTVQKNTYSTESLLQTNDNHYVNNKTKNTSKSYDASNLCISSNVNSNQGNGNLQMEFDNFSHTNFSNSYCYPGTVNAPLYTTSNYLPVTGASSTSSYSCINSNYMPESNNDYSSNVDNNFYTKMDTCVPLDMPKYNFDSNKNSNVLNKQLKSENIKKEVAMKRQRKSKTVAHDTYLAGTQRCYPTSGNNCNDDSVYGYQMAMGSYPSSLPPHKGIGQHVKPGAVSPNHSGTSSLTNFNLSTIFPEINKRPAMPGYPDSSHKPSMSLYL